MKKIILGFVLIFGFFGLVSSAYAGSQIFTRPLQLRFMGEEVSLLQDFLKKEKLYSGPVDGYFGQTTKNAVMAFQGKYKIQSTGTVGPITRAKLNSLIMVSSVSTNATIQNQFSNNTFCNGKNWLPCPSGQTFSCPTTGDPVCKLPELTLAVCNGISYSPCAAGQTFSCPASGTAKCLLPELTLAEQENKWFTSSDEKGWLGFSVTYNGEKRHYIKENGVWFRKNTEAKIIQDDKLPATDRLNEIKNLVSNIEAKQKECEAKKQADTDAENNNPYLSESLRSRKIKNIMERQCAGGRTYAGSNSSSGYQSYSISPNGMGGYQIMDEMNFNTWQVRNNGVGGYTISSY